jgi:hypothetical protein
VCRRTNSSITKTVGVRFQRDLLFRLSVIVGIPGFSPWRIQIPQWFANRNHGLLLIQARYICGLMRQSMSARVNPYHSAWTESFMGTLKTGMLKEGSFIDCSDARTEIFEYIEACYKAHHKRSSPGDLTPAQFEAQIHFHNQAKTAAASYQ